MATSPLQAGQGEEPENPPAFLIPDERDEFGCGIREGSRGLSMRDWFAGQALAGILANAATRGDPHDLAATAAEVTYVLADAMLAERAKGGAA